MKSRHTTARSATSRRRFAGFRGKALSALSLGTGLALAAVGHALAQGATSPTGGLGAQLNTMSGEAINSGGTAFGMACYLAAAICFGLGVWALWQSRQPQNRETGYVGRGIAGLVLCELVGHERNAIRHRAINGLPFKRHTVARHLNAVGRSGQDQLVLRARLLRPFLEDWFANGGTPGQLQHKGRVT